MKNSLKYIVPAIIVANAQAGELTLEAKPFAIVHAFDATALPEEVVHIRLDPDAWSVFEIVSIAGHGTQLKKGDPLVVFDAEDIERKIADTRQSIASGALELAQAELDLATLEKTVPEQLERLKRGAAVAAEELDYFTKTGRKAAEESAAQSLKRQEQLLASYQEELKQLLQMYKADDITEDTEEIILQKQRDSVEYAEFALRMENLDHKRKLEVSLPRQAVSLTEKRDDTALQLDTASQDLPRSLELKKLEVAGLKTALARSKETLADLEKDRALFDIKAPADGMFYHGSIDDGKWTTGDVIKGLEPDGSAPVGKDFATFIPATANLVVCAFLDQADAAALSVGSEGIATLSGREHLPVPVKVTSLSQTPNPGGSYPAILAAEWPEEVTPVAGQSLKIRMLSYVAEKALVVPVSALDFGVNGWTVEVKLADGKTERRAVTRGRTSGEETEITAGLEAGQVVILP